MWPENPLYEQWRDAGEDVRREIEATLFDAIRHHAEIVVRDKLGEDNPDLIGDITLAVRKSLPNFRGEAKFST